METSGTFFWITLAMFAALVFTFIMEAFFGMARSYRGQAVFRFANYLGVVLTLVLACGWLLSGVLNLLRIIVRIVHQN